MEFEDETMRAFIPGFRNQLESQIKTTETFRSQLLRLIRDADKKQLLDRIGKGSTYFQFYPINDLDIARGVDSSYGRS